MPTPVLRSVAGGSAGNAWTPGSLGAATPAGLAATDYLLIMVTTDSVNATQAVCATPAGMTKIAEFQSTGGSSFMTMYIFGGFGFTTAPTLTTSGATCSFWALSYAWQNAATTNTIQGSPQINWGQGGTSSAIDCGTFGGTSNTPTIANGVHICVFSQAQLTNATYSAPGGYTSDGFTNNANSPTANSKVYYKTINALTTLVTVTSDIGTAIPSTDRGGQSFILTGNLPPNAPTLQTPAPAAVLDLAAGGTFTATYTDPEGAVSASYAFKRNSGGADEWWNATSSTWQGSEVFNTAAVNHNALLSVVFPSGKWSNGTVYNWTIAMKDSSGTGSNQGPYASTRSVTASTAPAATVTAPTGTVTSTIRPTVTWSYSDAEGSVQTTWRAKIFSQAQYSAGGFDPATSVPTADSGEVSGTATSWLDDVDLVNGATYRAYVQVSQTGAQYSAWAFSGFTISLDPPAQPVIVSVTPDSTQARETVVVQARDNMLSLNQSSLETNTTGWTALANCAIARVTTQAVNGIASLQLTSSAAGNMSAVTTTGTGGVPCVAGQQVTAIANFKAATVARSCSVDIAFYNAAGAFISTSSGAGANDATANFGTQRTVTAVAPAGAAFAAVVVNVLATGAAAEVHWVDVIAIAPGTSTVWTRGGLVGITTIFLEYSEDGGTTWDDVEGYDAAAISLPSQQLSAIDVEPKTGVGRIYRATAKAVI